MGALSLLESDQRPDVIQFELGISARPFNTLFIDFVKLFQALNYDLFVSGQSFLMNLPRPILIDNIYENGNFVAVSSSAPKEPSKELTHNVKQLFQSWQGITVVMVEVVVGSGFEPLKAEPADLQSAPIGRSGNPPVRLCCARVTRSPLRSQIT